MAKRKYRSAQGKMVDMNALIANNETVPSIGNMAVNARGDEILSDGTIIKTREELMKEYHNLSTMIPEDGPIPESVADAAQIDTDADADADTEMWGNDGDVPEGENVQKPKDSKEEKGVSKI